ncbi:MAG: NifU family protein, partial [Prochlorococcaceae cyanobacterium]
MSTETVNDPRALTIENVERVLDELRPYLMADGGNVE